MERQKKVLDASVMVKWFAEETDTDKAVHLKEAHQNREFLIVVPSLAFAEVLNSLQYKKNNEKMLSETNKALWEMQFEVVEVTETLLGNAMVIAQQYHLTVYDALYAAVAQLHGAPLITADVPLSKVPNSILLEKM